MPIKPDSPHAVVHAGSGTVRTEPLPTGSSARTPTQAREKEEISAVERSIWPGCPRGVEQIEWTVCTRAPATAHRGTPAQHVRATLTAEAVRGSADGGGGAGGADGRFAPHGSIRHTSTATMRTRMPGLSGREGKEPPSDVRSPGDFLQRTWNAYYVALKRSTLSQFSRNASRLLHSGLAEIELSNLPDCDRLGMVLARNATMQQSAWPEQSEPVQ